MSDAAGSTLTVFAVMMAVMLARATIVSLAGIVLVASAVALADPGDLDSTFGKNGIVTTGWYGNDRLRALALQPDGKIVAAGENGEVLVARLTVEGRADDSFGNGRGACSFGAPTSAFANAVAVQPDGKIIAAGGFTNSSDNYPYAVGGLLLVRFRADGTLDRDFGENGGVLLDESASHGAALALALGPDGKIITGGPAFTVIRFLPDGHLDPEFGIGGVALADVSPSDIAVRALSMQPDGSIIAAGTRGDASGVAVFALRRFDAYGRLDETYGTRGSATSLYAEYSWPGMAITPDGKLLIVGQPPGALFFDFGVARYLSDGTPDSTFGLSGLTVTDFGRDEVADAVMVQPDGRIVVVGTSSSIGEASTFAVARYESNGEPDATFGFDGTVTTLICGRYDEAYAAIVQPDGRIVVGGTQGGACGSDDHDLFAIVRYLGTSCGNGTLDPGEECDGSGCCTSACTFAEAGVVCRPASGPCDLTERCSGEAAECPSDRVAPDDTSCADGSFGDGGKKCRGGVCVDGLRPCAAGSCDEQSRSCPPPSTTTVSTSSPTSTTQTIRNTIPPPITTSTSSTTTTSRPPDERPGDEDGCTHRTRGRPLPKIQCALSSVSHRLDAANGEDIDRRTRHRLIELVRALRIAHLRSEADVRRANRALERLQRAVERATITGRISPALSQSLGRALRGLAADFVRVTA